MERKNLKTEGEEGMNFLKTTIVLVAIVVAVFTAFVYLGIYNVAATKPHTELASKVFEVVRTRSIQVRAKNITLPSSSDNDIITGAHHYEEMCVTCHGGPGINPSEIGKGLNPKPPNLGKSAKRWNSKELFWILKHGIKMTGMPAFGPTHTDKELWSIVAFIERLPEISEEEYKNMLEKSNYKEHDNNHLHNHSDSVHTH